MTDALLEPGPSFLIEIIRSGGASWAAPTSAARDQLLAMAEAWRPREENSPGLVGRACPCSAAAWHLQRLLVTSDTPETNRAVDEARRLYHARWLGHLLMPDCAGFRPTVTIIVPVYNRAAMAVEAVESCLAQTWRPLEILIVDDGSTDDLASALAGFGDAVRMKRQSNAGLSAARNRGMQMAKGDFVHFLDSDDLLLPAAVARKLDAFARIPDAELCYSLAVIEGERLAHLSPIAPPNGSPRCPTVSLFGDGLSCPFYVSCVMLPRFTLLATGGFEEDLRRGEDTRLWINLALRDTKVVGLDAKLTVRRLSNSTLSAAPMPRALQLLVRCRTVADLLGQRRTWTLAARSFPGLLHILLQDDDQSSHPGLAEANSRLLAAIGALGQGYQQDGMSPLPLLAHLRHLTRRAQDSSPALNPEVAGLIGQLCSSIDQAARGAGPLTLADVSFWANASVSRHGKRRINSFFDHAESLIKDGRTVLSTIDELLRNAPSIPAKRAIDTYVRLRRLAVPQRIALRLVLRKSN